MKTFDQYINESDYKDINKKNARRIRWTTWIKYKLINKDNTIDKEYIPDDRRDKTLIRSIKNSCYYAINVHTGKFELANGDFWITKTGSFVKLKDGKLHCIDGPASTTTRWSEYYYNGNRIILISDKKIVSFYANFVQKFIMDPEFETLLCSILSDIGIASFIEQIDKLYNQPGIAINFIINIIDFDNIPNNARNGFIIYSIQPEVFSDKVAKKLIDKIPVNLAYFLLSKHIELSHNILKCYSDKQNLISDIRKIDNTHDLDIAGALERLIKHENI